MAIALGCENRWEPCFGTLARVPLAGGTPREVLEDVASADWSPDGKELAAIHAVQGGDRIEYPIGKVLYKSGGYLTGLRISPHGDRIAFIEHPQGDDQRGMICVVDRGGRKKNLTGEWRQLVFTLWSPKGEEVFSERMNLFFKSIAVRRIYDKTTDTLVYLAYSRQLQDASAKMGLSTIALFNTNVTWSGGKP